MTVDTAPEPATTGTEKTRISSLKRALCQIFNEDPYEAEDADIIERVRVSYEGAKRTAEAAQAALGARKENKELRRKLLRLVMDDDLLD